jgi:hypothetical protein
MKIATRRASNAGMVRFAAAALAVLTAVVRPPLAAAAPRCGKACRAARASCRSDCLQPRRDCAQSGRSDCRGLLEASCDAFDSLQSCLDDCAGKPNQDAFNVCAVNCCTKPAIRDPLVSCEEDFDACVAYQTRQCMRGLGGRRVLRSCLAACRAGTAVVTTEPAVDQGCYCEGRWRRCRAPLQQLVQNCQGGCQQCFDSQGHGAIAAIACRTACSDNSNVSDRLGNCDFQRAVCEFQLCHGPPPPTTTTTTTSRPSTSTTTTSTTATTTYTTTT